MKNKKLNLRELKVESFVTKLNKKENETVDGGITITTIIPISEMYCGIIIELSVIGHEGSKFACPSAWPCETDGWCTKFACPSIHIC